MKRVVLANGKAFDVEDDETILDGALRSGVNLEYSCRTGRCGVCKSGVRSGATREKFFEFGLTDEDREKNAILVCARTASEDVVLDVCDLGDVVIPPRKISPCRISSLERPRDDVLRVGLRLPPADPLKFLAGQYVDVTAKNGTRRSYSIANAPRADGTLELHIRRVEGGAMSRYWFETAAVNDLLRVSGPQGTFFLREREVSTLVLLATGTGIAPIKAILEDLAAVEVDRRPRRIMVLWGGRAASDLYWDPRSVGLELDYIPVVSRPDASWSGAEGHVQDVLVSSGSIMNDAVVYACGSVRMIESARRTLVGVGLDSHAFHSDAFVAST